MTPLAGRGSGPVANGVWAGLNLAAGALLLSRKRTRGSAERWDGDLVAFDAGCLAFALWMTGAEAKLRMNWDPSAGRARAGPRPRTREEGAARAAPSGCERGSPRAASRLRRPSYRP
ncbi:hypothetical protein HNR25_002584 [Streptomonospora salina]|uniref:Uncharacterized protein n=1 Tax=Streptomonospora salina TaxID=104205 RepID=A0A841ECP3_9ACTN|nr:hypothetical protein [Streptomonospora salina]